MMSLMMTMVVGDVGGADCGVLDVGSADFAEYRCVEDERIHVCGK